MSLLVNLLSMSNAFYLLVLTVVFLYLYSFVNAYLSPLRKVPGRPFRKPLFGTFWDYVREDCELLKLIAQDSKVYGNIRKSYLFLGNIRLNVGEPESIKHILVNNAKNYKRGDFPGFEKIFLAVGENGLVVVNGELHRRLRKFASPAFKLSTLKKVMPIIDTCGQRLVNLFLTMCKESSQQPTEIGVKELLNKTTLDIIGLLAFGYDFEEACSFQTDTFGCDMRSWFEQQKLQYDSMLPFALPFLKTIVKAARYCPRFMFKNAQTTNRIHDLVDNIVKTKIEQAKSGKRLNGSTTPTKSLLEFILEASDTAEINRQELHDLLMTFLIAGHETSTVAITWTLYLLAKHPEHQRKCMDEVTKAFQDNGGKLDWDDVRKLSYLNAVIHESLRLYPPVPWLHRVSIAEDHLAGYYIPPETDVLAIIAEMHRNGEYWPQPDEFVPERFLEPEDSIPWDAFMPFGDGPHKCIGYQLALVEIAYLLSVLVKNFEFTIDPSVKYRDYAILTMQPKPPLRLFVKVLQ